MKYAVVFCLTSVFLTPWARAQDRFADVYAKRVELQRDLRNTLEHTLRRIAHPYDLVVMVEVNLEGHISEQVQRDSQPGMEMKLESQKALKLPGLPEQPLTSAGPDAPSVSLKLPAHDRVKVSQKLDAMVKNIAVRVYLEEGIPEAQREQVKAVATQLAGIDKARGDVLEILDMPARLAMRVSDPLVVTQRGVWVASATFLLCTLIIAFALTRRREGGGGATLSGSLTASSDGTGAGPASSLMTAGTAVDGTSLDATTVTSTASFATLRQASQEQLLETLMQLPAELAAVVLDQAGLAPALATRYLESIDAKKRVALARALGQRKVMPVVELQAMEERVQAVLDEVQSRVAVGSTAKLADLLADASGSLSAELLQNLATSDPELADEVRGRMVTFADLEHAEPAVIREVAASTTAAQLALALHGAEDTIRRAVKQAVSKRLLRILEAEEESLASANPSTDDIETARRSVAAVLRRASSGAPKQENRGAA